MRYDIYDKRVKYLCGLSDWKPHGCVAVLCSFLFCYSTSFESTHYLQIVDGTERLLRLHCEVKGGRWRIIFEWMAGTYILYMKQVRYATRLSLSEVLKGSRLPRSLIAISGCSRSYFSVTWTETPVSRGLYSLEFNWRISIQWAVWTTEELFLEGDGNLLCVILLHL